MYNLQNQLVGGKKKKKQVAELLPFVYGCVYLGVKVRESKPA